MSEQEIIRELARIVKIDNVVIHPNADRLELALVGGWQVVVQKGLYKAGDLALFCEIDSLLPTDISIFSFLEDKASIKVINLRSYARIKTIRLRGELSQGILFPVTKADAPTTSNSCVLAFENRLGVFEYLLPEGEDCTELLGVKKYEPRETTAAAEELKLTWLDKFCNWIKGDILFSLEKPWPSFLTKSAQPRVQNINSIYQRAVDAKERFTTTIKLNGSSMTVYLRADGTSGVCGRNNELRTENINWTFMESVRVWLASFLSGNRRCLRNFRLYFPKWKRGIAAEDNYYVEQYHANNKRLLGLITALANCLGISDHDIAIQGELCGPGIQGNAEGLHSRHFFIYDVYSGQPNTTLKKLPMASWFDLVNTFCPWGQTIMVVNDNVLLPPTIKECLATADGEAVFAFMPFNGGKKREGLVYRSNSNPNFSFKVISNNFLETNDEE